MEANGRKQVRPCPLLPHPLPTGRRECRDEPRLCAHQGAATGQGEWRCEPEAGEEGEHLGAGETDGPRLVRRPLRGVERGQLREEHGWGQSEQKASGGHGEGEQVRLASVRVHPWEAGLAGRRPDVGVQHEELAVQEIVDLLERAELDQVEEEQRWVRDAAVVPARHLRDDPVVRVAVVLPVLHHAVGHRSEQVGSAHHAAAAPRRRRAAGRDGDFKEQPEDAGRVGDGRPAGGNIVREAGSGEQRRVGEQVVCEKVDCARRHPHVVVEHQHELGGLVDALDGVDHVVQLLRRVPRQARHEHFDSFNRQRALRLQLLDQDVGRVAQLLHNKDERHVPAVSVLRQLSAPVAGGLRVCALDR
mmetsp:Transcript_32170/g.102523  ORF Transcript_32170/g.102523 Transcript_32170/m.102523 type:complete len:360 (+) Transcript_32170:361-1440(+)